MSVYNPCPKCHAGRLSGPVYQPGDAGGLDWLIYRCACGYEEKRPPKDRAPLDGSELARRYLADRR